MPYINVHIAYPRNRKTLRLVSRLGLCADIYPIRLWCWLAEHEPESGSFGDLTDSEVETMLGWNGEAGRCVGSLIEVGFLTRQPNGQLSCPKWEDRQGHIIAFSERGRIANKIRWERERLKNKEESRTPSGTPKSETRSPSGSPPNQSIPIHTKNGNADAEASAARACDFSVFYGKYVKKVGRKAAERAWKTHVAGKIALPVVMAGLKRALVSDQWERGFIPNPATWLNQGRWEDEPEAPQNARGSRQSGVRDDFVQCMDCKAAKPIDGVYCSKCLEARK